MNSENESTGEQEGYHESSRNPDKASIESAETSSEPTKESANAGEVILSPGSNEIINILSPDSNEIINYLPISNKRIGEILVEQGKLTQAEVDRILNKQQENTDVLFGEAAVDLRFTDQEAVNNALSIQFGYPVLPVTGKDSNVDLVTVSDPSGKRAEEFRDLRGQLLLQWFDHDRKTLTALGAERHEGCSNTISNLAVTFAQLGKRTLLIDGDMRSPELHNIFNLPRNSGLSTILSGRKNDCLPYQINTLPSLFVLPSGPVPPNPQELIIQPSFKILLAIASDKFDVVLIDTPPAHMFSDAEIIASLVEGAFIVIKQDKTRTDLLKELIERLNISNVTIAGCVLNSH